MSMYPYLLVFMLLTGYAIFFAPGAGGSEDAIFQALIRGEFDAVDPLVTAVFSSLGVYPFIFLMILTRIDTYRIPAWPFALFSFGLGAFAVLPWLIIRGKQIRSEPRGPKLWHTVLRSKILIGVLTAVSLSLFVTAFFGSLAQYGDAFMASHLVSVMTVDLFVIFWMMYTLFKYELGFKQPLIAVIPLIGPLGLFLKSS